MKAADSEPKFISHLGEEIFSFQNQISGFLLFEFI